MHVRSLVCKADDAVTLPFVAPFGQTPPRGIVTRSIEAGAEAADLAADQIRKRAKEWGPGGIDTRFGAAWSGFAPMLNRWLKVVEGRGDGPVKQVYLDTLAGRVPPDQGHILSLAT